MGYEYRGQPLYGKTAPNHGNDKGSLRDAPKGPALKWAVLQVIVRIEMQLFGKEIKLQINIALIRRELKV